MGVLYDVLFKPIGRGDGSSSVSTGGGDQSVPPEWVLDKRDGGGPLVWRRLGLPSTNRKRVQFLDAVEVRVFDRDDCCTADATTDDGNRGHDDDHDDGDGDDDDDDHRHHHRQDGRDDDDDHGQLFWTDDWCWDDEDGHSGGSDTDKTLFYQSADRGNDYPLLFAASLTVLAVCVGLAYLFAPVKWLFHQLIVD